MTDDDKQKYEDDYNYSRDTLYDLIEKGRESIGEMLDVARESEHPRAYEVLGKLIKDVGDVSDKLAALNKAKKDLEKEESEGTNKLSGGDTNNIFIGSTTELQKFLMDLTKQPEKVINPTDSE